MVITCLVIAVLCIPLAIAVKCLVLYLLAQKNVFFTFVPEGQIIVIVRGRKGEMYLGNIKEYWVHPRTGEVITEASMTSEQKETRKKFESRRNPILKYFGAHFIGIWPFCRRYSYHFRWNKWARKENSSDYVLVPKEDDVDSLYFRFTYPIRIDSVETKGKVPLDITLLINTRVTNADKAFFKTGDWLASITGAVTTIVRDFIGARELEEISQMQFENSDGGLIKEVKILNDSAIGNPSLDEMFGVIIDAVNFVGYEISGEDGERLRKASTDKYVATQEAEAVVVTATAQAEATVKTAEAQAKAIRSKGEAEAEIAKKKKEAMGMHPNIAMAEAIKETKVRTLILGQGILPTMPISEEEGE